MRWLRGSIAVALLLVADYARAEPCSVTVTWTLPLEIARSPGALETQAALAVWGPTTPEHAFEDALRGAERAGVTSRVAVDGRRVSLRMSADSERGCSAARALANEKKTAVWTEHDRGRVARIDLERYAPTRGVAEQALIGRTVAGLDAKGSRRTEDPPAYGDGRARLVMAWPLDGDELANARAVVGDLGHPGGTLAQRLLGAHGTADALTVVVTSEPAAIVVAVTTRDTREARDRLMRELEAFEVDPHPDATRDAVEIERFVRRLPRLPVTELVRVAPMDEGAVSADADTALIFVAASIDLRCPAPGELRDSATLLEEKHGLDAARYLALSRALGRDPERFQAIDLEVRFRCSERAKLARLAPAQKVVALYKVVRCAAGPDAARVKEAAFERARLDPSALRPLVALVRDQPRWTAVIEDIERQCPETP